MNKKKAPVFLALLLILALGAAGTAAYFNAQAKTRNVITTGNIGLELICDGKERLGRESELNIEGIMPGEVIVTSAAVENSGSGTCWIRVRLEPEIMSSGGDSLDSAVLKAEYNEKFWIGDGEYWYYTRPVVSGQITEDLYESLSFDISMGNEYQGAEAVVRIAAQAVQTANNSPAEILDLSNYKEVKGWPGDGQGGFEK